MSTVDSVPVGWTVKAVGSSKQPCRLCYYETTDTVEIFSSSTEDYPAKIQKYLYLQVSCIEIALNISKVHRSMCRFWLKMINQKQYAGCVLSTWKRSTSSIQRYCSSSYDVFNHSVGPLRP